MDLISRAQFSKIPVFVDNIDNIKVMNKVCTKYFAALSADDLYSLKLTTLWKCLNKYDPSKKTKFTTFLYQQLDYAIRNTLKKKIREFNCRQLEKSIDAVDNIDHVLDGLSDEYTVLIKQKYVYGMTMEEMGRQNGYSRETARRRFKKALKSFEKINR